MLAEDLKARAVIHEGITWLLEGANNVMTALSTSVWLDLLTPSFRFSMHTSFSDISAPDSATAAPMRDLFHELLSS